MAAGASPLPPALHAHRLIVAEPGGARFGELTAKRPRRGIHRSVQALERDIQAWLADWNEHPRPFAWTKTADEILDKVATYCQRISDSGARRCLHHNQLVPRNETRAAARGCERLPGSPEPRIATARQVSDAQATSRARYNRGPVTTRCPEGGA